ncbi:hypothetical protein L195_g053892, partial [Trifolium pratense]
DEGGGAATSPPSNKAASQQPFQRPLSSLMSSLFSIAAFSILNFCKL